MTAPTRSLEFFTERLNENAATLLLDTVLGARSRLELRRLLDDLLTREEFAKLEQRVKALVASVLVEATSSPSTQVCVQLDLNYQTYVRAKNVCTRGAGGVDLILRSLAERSPEFSELRSVARKLRED